jgi:uncharacterized protein DUF4136
MRIINIIALCALLMVSTFAIAQDIKTDHDHAIDFAKYRTFKWIKEPDPENPLMKQRIMEAINAQLEAKGLTLAADNADLGLAANTATKQEQTLDSFYGGFPGWGWRRYWGGPVIVDTYEVGTLLVDLFDTQTKQVVWWASASDTVSDKPEKNSKNLDKAVEKMFKDFPPKSARKTD